MLNVDCWSHMLRWAGASQFFRSWGMALTKGGEDENRDRMTKTGRKKNDENGHSTEMVGTAARFL
jgi:hypothetical protein